MSFLRNPFVSGLLAAVAVVLLFYRLVLPRWQSRGLIVPPSITQLVAPNRVPATSTSRVEPFVETFNTLPERGIDREFIEARFAKWVASPQRDPFLLLGVDPDAKSKEELDFHSPIVKWKLNCIWNQTGSRLAVINGRVHQIGDYIEAYKIIRIEDAEVWFQGPKRKERLGLAQHGPVVLPNPVFLPATNQPPANVPQ